MVVVDSTISERFCRNKYNRDVYVRRQQLLEEDAAAEIAISNFCPRLRESIELLSRHKVGPLLLKVHLSEFQSSTDGPSSSTKPPRYDRFVLGLPYFSEHVSATASNQVNLVRWSILAKCNRPDRVPDFILLGVDDLSVNSGDASLLRLQDSQRSQSLLRRNKTHHIIQERFWQQYVATDGFSMPCISKWNKMINEGLLTTQYCLLADQLYECYGQFQLYKLKMSTKPVPSLQQPPQLVEAYNQYKQLAKLAKSADDLAPFTTVVTTKICVELLVELEDICVSKEYDDRQNQRISTGIVRMRAIIVVVPIEPTGSSPCSTDSDQNQNDKVLYLTLVNTTFAPPSISHKNSFKQNNTSSKSKYVVRIVNSNQQPDMIESMLDTISEPVLDTSMIDFVTYVSRVQHFAVKLYNCDMEFSDIENPSSDNKCRDSVQLVLESLLKTFCDLPTNGNCLLDYQINSDPSTNKTSSIRFLLVDDNSVPEITRLKYILRIEFSKEVCSKLNSSTSEENIDEATAKTLVPIVALCSVYDDENPEYYLNTEIADTMANTISNKNNAFHDELAKLIKTTTTNAMRRLRVDILTPVLTRYNEDWSPSDPYFVRSSQKPPSYPSK